MVENKEHDTRITIADLRKVRKGNKEGYCLPGLKRWAAENHFSFELLVKNGILKSQIPRLDDPFVKKLLAVAEERESRERGEV